MQSFSLGRVTSIGGSIVTQRFRGMLLGEIRWVCPRTTVDVVGFSKQHQALEKDRLVRSFPEKRSVYCLRNKLSFCAFSDAIVSPS